MPLGLKKLQSILGKQVWINCSPLIVIEYKLEGDSQVFVTDHGTVKINWKPFQITFDQEFQNYLMYQPVPNE